MKNTDNVPLINKVSCIHPQTKNTIDLPYTKGEARITPPTVQRAKHKGKT